MCRKSGPRPAGQSYDEFPFAATREGAWAGQPANAATTGFPVSYTLGDFNAQWTYAGVLLSRFYRLQRVLDAEYFFVQVIP